MARSRHRTNWYARIVIPHDLRYAYAQRREIRKTLYTPCKVTARRRAMLLWLAYQQVFESPRNGHAEEALPLTGMPWSHWRLHPLVKG
ncbi:DUF6538 domain-containing protein [Halomonas sp.]|uniref:DUF6538 domain-containing protein n=1 Tax=Halomonas sp. TaxID=1486246 RepID=UPI00384CE93D